MDSSFIKMLLSVMASTVTLISLTHLSTGAEIYNAYTYGAPLVAFIAPEPYIRYNIGKQIQYSAQDYVNPAVISIDSNSYGAGLGGNSFGGVDSEQGGGGYYSPQSDGGSSGGYYGVPENVNLDDSITIVASNNPEQDTVTGAMPVANAAARAADGPNNMTASTNMTETGTMRMDTEAVVEEEVVVEEPVPVPENSAVEVANAIQNSQSSPPVVINDGQRDFNDFYGVPALAVTTDNRGPYAYPQPDVMLNDPADAAVVSKTAPGGYQTMTKAIVADDANEIPDSANSPMAMVNQTETASEAPAPPSPAPPSPAPAN